MAARRRGPPMEDSWRMVEGEHDSFDTSILPSSPYTPPNPSSQEPSSGFPTQTSANVSFASQDSIRDFSRYQEDDDNDEVILREPFRPSLPRHSSRPNSTSYRTPVPEFNMPLVEVESPRRGLRRSPRGGKSSSFGYDDGVDLRGRFKHDQGSPPQRRALRRVSASDELRSGKHPKSNYLPAFLYDVARWFYDLFGLAFRYAQRPLAVLLCVYGCFIGLTVLRNVIRESTPDFSVICHVPGSSYLPLGICSSSFSTHVTEMKMKQPVDFDDLMNIQAKFEQVLEKSAEGVSLPFEMKRSEASIRDLRTLVRNSEIQSRDELVLEFDGFIDIARQSASDLQKFNTHCGSAVDAVVAINRWTARFIDSLASPDPAETSLLQRWTGWFLSALHLTTQRNLDERMILDKYIEHTALVSGRISTLILEAQAVLRLLTKAEDHLSLIYDISSRSLTSVASHRHQIFRNIWTLVGANSAKLHSLSRQLSLLHQVEDQRTTAVAQVSALVLELEAIQAGLGDLRDRVVEPQLIHGALLNGDGVSASAASIPLSVHIETIHQAVRRLEDARRRIGAAENDRVREALLKGGVPAHQRLIEG